MPRGGASAARGARTLFAAGMLCVRIACAAAPDTEQGLPIISTFLPSKFNTPSTPVGPQSFALATLGDGSIVVANNSGLLRLNGTSATAWNPLGGNVLSLTNAADGNLYVGGIGRIGWFREFGGEFHSLVPQARALGVELGDVWISIAARNGDVYFADATHVFRWDGHELRTLYLGQPELLVGAAFGDGAVVLDPETGLVAVDAHGARNLRDGARIVHSGRCALAAAPDGVLSACSDGGVLHWRVDGDVRDVPIDAEVRVLLQNAGVTTAALRDDGSLFIGTRRNGMFMLDRDGKLNGRLSTVPEWGDSRVFSELLRHDDGFWVGLDYGVAHVEWPGQLTRFDASLGLPRAALATARVNGTLLAATARGVYRMVAPEAGSVFARFESIVPTRTTLFAIAQVGDTLFLASGDGVYRVQYGAATQLDTELAYTVRPLDADTLLAGGLKSARVLRRNAMGWSSQDIAGVDSEIRHIVRDDDGAIWLTGNYTGVFRLQPKDLAVERFGVNDGLPQGRIVPLRLPNGLAFDGADGLMRFDAAAKRFVADAALRTLLPHASGETRSVTLLDATRAYVVQHDRVRLIERAANGTWRELFTPLARLPRGLDFRDVRLDADGSVWIAGNEALFQHRPQTQSTLPDLPPPRVLVVDDDGRTLPAANAALDLGTAPHTVHAKFEEAFFDGVEQLRFRTKLEPLESAWTDWQVSTEREMTQLPGGRYRLHLQVRDIFGRESAEANIAFALAPPWFLRWWAFTLYAIAAGLAIAAMTWRRERRLRARAQELETLVSARTRELEMASVTDALTGLRNRHYVQLLGTPWRQRGDWLVALVDLDHFKRVNDERGHAAGDVVLREVARRLTGVLPQGATAVRWGGEEFLLIVELDSTMRDCVLVENVLHAVGDTVIEDADTPLVATCSVGWEVVPAGSTLSLDAILGNADRRLYAAKNGGRDRACGPRDIVLTRTASALPV